MGPGQEADALASVAVAIHGLEKRYRRGALALDDVDLQISRGEITALVGPNGAGKTTLLKILLGFEQATEGAVHVFGLDPWRERAASLMNVGYVPQASAQYSGLTVEDHLELARFNRPTLDIGSAVGRLREIGVPLHVLARRLSGGEQAQLSLAIALATHAPLLLLDEPLANLDPLARREFLQELLRTAHEDGATVILTSHIVSDVEEACSSLVVIGTGRIRLHGTISAALEGHVILHSDEPPAGAERIGLFSGRAGESSVLWRLSDATPRVPTHGAYARPTLEELVLGYLARDRR